MKDLGSGVLVIEPHSVVGDVSLFLADHGGHCNSIAIMSASFFGRDRPVTIEQVRKDYVECTSAFAFLACAAGVIGFLGYILVKLFPESVVIVQIGVEREHRRRGLGRAMVEEVQRAADTLDRPLLCRIAETDRVAWDFFRACNLSGFGVCRATVPGGRDEYLMRSQANWPEHTEV
jgi:ribosomal protein S18 acetylase RimI-like enzyme